MIWKAICRDIFSWQRLYLFGVSLMIALMIKETLPHEYTLTTMLFSVLIISLISSWQLFFSYFKTSRIQGYYQLPIALPTFYTTFLVIVFLANIIERLSLLLILFGEDNWKNILFLILYSFFVIVSNFRLIRYWTRPKGVKFKFFLAFYIFILLVILFVIPSIVLLLLLIGIELWFIYKDPSNFYLDEVSGKGTRFNFRNYFVTAIVKERYVYFDIAVSLLFIATLLLQDLPENLKFPMLFTVASVNTPLTTLISSSPQLNVHIRSLPKSYVIYWMYMTCLLSYYFVMNISIAVVYTHVTGNWKFLVWVVFYTIFETIAYLLLEKYFCINNWKIKKELWKHPRKYVVPLITYIFFFLLFT